MEDDRVTILEQQLAQAKLIAEEADKKYEEVEKVNYFSIIKKLVRTCFHHIWETVGFYLGPLNIFFPQHFFSGSFTTTHNQFEEPTSITL